MSERTEKPTPRRLREARRRGEVAASRELCGAAALAAGLAALASAGPRCAAGLAGALRSALAAGVGGEPDPAAALAASAEAFRAAAAPVLLPALGGALAAGLLQTRFLLAPAAAAPRWSRLDPAAGLRRLLSPASLGGALLALFRGLAAIGVGAVALRGAAPPLATLPGLGPAALARALPALAEPLAFRLAALLLAFGLLDLLLAHLRHGRAMRMARPEVVREQREEEGDPWLKGERRRLHGALASARPLARAAVVVVNPLHLAVAIAHRRGSDEVPQVLAKGAGTAAVRIRSLARRAGVPVVRDVALARSLFRLAEVGEAIPEELWEAAAALLVRVHGLVPEEAG